MNPVGNEAVESKRDCRQGIGRSSVQAGMESPANRLSRLMTPTVGTTVGICLPSVGPTPVQRRRKVVQGKYSFSSCGDTNFGGFRMPITIGRLRLERAAIGTSERAPALVLDMAARRSPLSVPGRPF
jgi:hypothetical protein